MTDGSAFDRFFAGCPDPMWLYEFGSLAFVRVNPAAVARYGYSEADFLGMTIADIRPAEDVAALIQNVEASLTDGRGETVQRDGVWRHRLKSGEIVHVSITAQRMAHDGRDCELIQVHDVTRLIALEDALAESARREAAARAHAESEARRFEALFQSAPGKYLVIEPRTFTVRAVSNAFLAALGRSRSEIQDRALFDILPDDPADPEAEGADRLIASLSRVASTGVADAIPLLRHPISLTHDGGGAFEPRWWRVLHTPVLDRDGAVELVILRFEDLTALAIDADGTVDADMLALLEARHVAGNADVTLRAVEVRRAIDRLTEREIDLRTAQRLLNLGVWRFDPTAGALRWDAQTCAIYGAPESAGSPSIDDYIALVHPDDREAMVARYQAFLNSEAAQIRFTHRIVRPDGAIRTVDGVGEKITLNDRLSVRGVVRDITDAIETERRATAAEQLLDVASRAARIGGWRVDAASRETTWTKGVFAIFDVDSDEEMPVEEALMRYEEQDRDRIAADFAACIETGKAFESDYRLRSVRDVQKWVRVFGESLRDPDGAVLAAHGAIQDVTELIKAQQRAASLSEELRETLESISDAFVTLDSAWRFTFVNREAERLLDRPRESLLGRSLWEEFPGAVGSRFQTEYEATMRLRESRRFCEYLAPLAKWLDVTAYPTQAGVAVYFRDVSDARRKESQLLLLESAVARLNDIVLITEAEPIDGPDGPRIVYVNDAFERRTGFSRAEAIGATPRILQGPGTDRRELDRISAALKDWRPIRSELVNYTKAGEPFWLELDIVPLADETGFYTHWIAVERDITERKAAEAAIREGEERFRLLAQASNDIIYDYRMDTGAIWYSDAMARVLGAEVADVADSVEGWKATIYDADRGRVGASFDRFIAGGGMQWEDEYRIQRADGSLVTVVDRALVIRDRDGRPIRIMGTMMDVTAAHEMEARLRQSQKLEAVGQLTGGVAHDFNNLLTIIIGNAEMLQDTLANDPERRHLAEVTMSAAERGAELTHRLLAFARRQPLDPKVTDIGSLLVGMNGMLRRTIAADIEIETVRGAGLWPAYIDPGQLEVAVLNLAINARDAMPTGGKLTFEVVNATLDEAYASDHPEVAPGRYVMLSVTDSGVGMPRETIEKALEPFFTTKTAGKGTGLGLSMVYGFVKQSRGHLKIYSEVGVGTTVRLYLPKAHDESAAVVSDRLGAAAPPRGSEHVLVVEDDPDVRAHAVLLLTGLGYRVTAASSGEEALAILATTDDVALLFTDVVMPGSMSGRELADLARRATPTLRVLFTSGYTENSIVHNGRLDPDVRLLSKPYRRIDLAVKVRQALDGDIR